MADNAAKAEKQILDVLVKAFDKLIKSTDNLSGAQLNGLGITTKALMHQRDVDVETRRNMVNVTKAVKLGHAQVEIKRKSIKVNEKLVKLRHVLNVRLEEEHGSQVRRNKMLQHSFDDVGSTMNFLTNSVKGNFGFGAALSGMTKKIIKGTKQFDALAENTILRDKAQAGLDEAKGAVSDHGKKGAVKGSLKEKEAELKARQKSMDNINEERDNIKGIGTGEKSKGMFGALSKMGKFFEKKALPIGLGMGVAGILMSVIVKSFSASPLFAAMMKMMKFMVTLILMPIGTFFGALLRPVLIMLLRKFIIPFYSHWMPVLMKVGGQLGAALSGEPLDPFNKIPPTNPEELSEMSLMEKLAAWADGWDMNNPFGLDAYADSEGNLKVAIKSGLIDSDGNQIITPEDIPKAAPDGDMNKTEDQEPLDVEATLVGGDRQPDGTILLPNGDVIKDGVTYKNADDLQDGESKREDKKKETPDEELARIRKEEERVQAQLNLEMEGESQAEEDAREAEERRLRSEQQKQEWRDEQQKEQNEQNARMDKAREDEEKRLRQEENQKRLSEALSKPAESTGADRMAAQEARNAEQETVNTENPRFAGTPSEGKLSSSQNAGMNVGKTIDKNATKKHTMGSSQAGSDILREYWASRGVTMAAEGFDGMVNKPTMFMAGEAGSEHVKVTPNGKGESGGSTITVNIQNMNAGDDDLRKLKKTILEVIQQSANNRGRI